MVILHTALAGVPASMNGQIDHWSFENNPPSSLFWLRSEWSEIAPISYQLDETIHSTEKLS